MTSRELLETVNPFVDELVRQRDALVTALFPPRSEVNWSDQGGRVLRLVIDHWSAAGCYLIDPDEAGGRRGYKVVTLAKLLADNPDAGG